MQNTPLDLVRIAGDRAIWKESLPISDDLVGIAGDSDDLVGIAGKWPSPWHCPMPKTTRASAPAPLHSIRLAIGLLLLGHGAPVDLLLDRGAAVDRTHGDGTTPSCSSPARMEMDARPWCACCWPVAPPWTALGFHTATRRCKSPPFVVGLLQQHGAAASHADAKGTTLLHDAGASKQGNINFRPAPCEKTK